MEECVQNWAKGGSNCKCPGPELNLKRKSNRSLPCCHALSGQWQSSNKFSASYVFTVCMELR